MRINWPKVGIVALAAVGVAGLLGTCRGFEAAEAADDRLEAEQLETSRLTDRNADLQTAIDRANERIGEERDSAAAERERANAAEIAARRLGDLARARADSAAAARAAEALETDEAFAAHRATLSPAQAQRLDLALVELEEERVAGAVERAATNAERLQWSAERLALITQRDAALTERDLADEGHANTRLLLEAERDLTLELREDVAAAVHARDEWREAAGRFRISLPSLGAGALVAGGAVFLLTR